ncbi:D-alanyl-D-alanine carboxypeptidase family protein [Pseudohoeflea coraliihabitans]|uniref:D-alanyl-D-alanine carboxypeptidase n=1 Tax=Pseudohoeflea coraliihabitans TaxID=2860393 RepID=A0ABS6WTT5_9HYPH|nr:D-alanyl-D-alanine carboxypeptidase family protein [Pseudohoeflea sp. DP4N28-3]MBW3098474.1 D-alanyl-D-alanine carboxypeptidase [Pseudohoeflea sp. DP4N28-3]
MIHSAGRSVTRTALALWVVVLSFAVGACSSTGALDSVPYSAPVPERFAAIVIDERTSKTLYSVRANETRYPASLTKMMTLYLLFQAIDSGRLRRDSQIPVSENAARQPASKLYLKAGSTISVDTAIRALVVKSANDVATAVAEYLGGGSEEHFAALMTRQARALGMSRTRFKNASGLPDSEQTTTASDMARLALALKSRYPHYYPYFSLRSFEHNGKTIRGHNKVLDMMSGVDGIKTGYTRASGFNLATSARSNGRRVVGVVMGEDSAKVRNERMVQLIRYAARQR